MSRGNILYVPVVDQQDRVAVGNVTSDGKTNSTVWLGNKLVSEGEKQNFDAETGQRNRAQQDIDWEMKDDARIAKNVSPLDTFIQTAYKTAFVPAADLTTSGRYSTTIDDIKDLEHGEDVNHALASMVVTGEATYLEHATDLGLVMATRFVDNLILDEAGVDFQVPTTDQLLWSSMIATDPGDGLGGRKYGEGVPEIEATRKWKSKNDPLTVPYIDPKNNPPPEVEQPPRKKKKTAQGAETDPNDMSFILSPAGALVEAAYDGMSAQDKQDLDDKSLSLWGAFTETAGTLGSGLWDLPGDLKEEYRFYRGEFEQANDTVTSLVSYIPYMLGTAVVWALANAA
jgi:hypothetical protein